MTAARIVSGKSVASMRRSLETTTARSMMFVPLIREQQVAGVIVIGHTTKVKAFQQSDLVLLQRFATLISIALENARLLEASQELTTIVLSAFSGHDRFMGTRRSKNRLSTICIL